MACDQFVVIFRQTWLPQLYFDKKLIDFQNIHQGDMLVMKYQENLIKISMCLNTNTMNDFVLENLSLV